MPDVCLVVPCFNEASRIRLDDFLDLARAADVDLLFVDDGSTDHTSQRVNELVGRSEGLGRPLLYGTTRHFLEHFGFRSLEELPRPEELPIVLRERIPLGVEGEDGAPPPDPDQVTLALGAVRNEPADEGFETADEPIDEPTPEEASEPHV